MNLVQLQRELAVAFPKVWIKEGSLFSNDHCESLWTGEGSMIEVNLPGARLQHDDDGSCVEIDAFDMYPMFESMYTFGVYNQLAKFLSARGYHAEAHDSGTFFIWKS